MAVVTFSLKFLDKLGVNMDKLEHYVDMMGMEVEKEEGDDIYIDITPNRPDLLDIFGFARALKYLDGKLKPKEDFYTLKHDPYIEITVSNSVKKVRPVIACMVVRDADLKDGKLKYIINFMEKLSDTYGRKRKKVAMGMHNIDMVEAPFTYEAVSKGAFVPLGSSNSMSFDQILKEHQKGTSYGYTLGDSKLYPVLRDSKGSIMSLIPIINSDLTKVKESTRNLLIDVTGTSENAVHSVLNLVACSFIDMGFDVYPCIIKYDSKEIQTPQLVQNEIRVKSIDVERTLGTRIDLDKIITYMNRMGFDGAMYGRYVIAHVPPYRIDVLNQQDIIEDIAIGYGYGNIVPMPVIGTSIGIADSRFEFYDKLSNILLGLGYTESINTYLTNETINFRNMLKDFDKKSVVMLAYSKVEVYTMMRTSILPQLMHNLSGSAHEPMPQKLFEVGKVFGIDGKPFERETLALVSEHSKANFSEIKSSIEAVLKLLGLKYRLTAYSDPSFIEGRCAAIYIDDYLLGIFGEISPDVLSNFNLDEPVAGAELDAESLLSLASTKQEPVHG